MHLKKNRSTFLCPWSGCRKYFKEQPMVAEHVNEVHNGIMPVNCEWDCCGQSYKSSELLKIHQRKVHYKNASHKCTKCDKACPSFEALKIHFLHTHTNWKKTDSPEREINSESSTVKEGTSSEPKTIHCTDFVEENLSSTVMDSGNANITDVLNNEKSIPSNVQSSGTVSSQPDSVSIVYECNTCDKCFKSLQALDRHRKVQHMDKSSLNCTTCNEQFKSFEQLKKHFICTHTNWKKEDGEESSDDDVQIEDNSKTEKKHITIPTASEDVTITTESSTDKCTNIATLGCKVSGLPKVTKTSRDARLDSDSVLNAGVHNQRVRVCDALNTPITNDLKYNVRAKLDELFENFTKRSAVKDNASNAKNFTKQYNNSNGNFNDKHLLVSLQNANEKADTKKITYYIVNTHSEESISNVKSLLGKALTEPTVRPTINTVQNTERIPSNSVSATNDANMLDSMLGNITPVRRSTLKVAYGTPNVLTPNTVNFKPAVRGTSNSRKKGKLSLGGYKTNNKYLRTPVRTYTNKKKSNPPKPEIKVTDEVYSKEDIIVSNDEMLDENGTQFDDDSVSSEDPAENSNGETSDGDSIEEEAAGLDEVYVELGEEIFDNNTPIDPFSEIKEYEHVPRPLVIKSEDIVEHMFEEINIHDCLEYIPAKRKHQDSIQSINEQIENIDEDKLAYLPAKRIKGKEENTASILLNTIVSEEHISEKINIYDCNKFVPEQRIKDVDLIIPIHKRIQNIDEESLEVLPGKIIQGEEENLDPIGPNVEEIDNLQENIESIKTEENTSHNIRDIINADNVLMDAVCMVKNREFAPDTNDTDIVDVDKNNLVLECLSSNRIPRILLERLPKALLFSCK